MSIGPAGHVDLTATAAVKASNGALVACVLTAGSDTATLILQDDPDSADGTVLVNLSAVANTSVTFSPSLAIAFANGCFASLTGTSPNATVVYV